jgi:hypothetical protein
MEIEFLLKNTLIKSKEKAFSYYVKLLKWQSRVTS